ncbi:MAG: glycosyltransferase [Micromonosporaceae bacterium]
MTQRDDAEDLPTVCVVIASARPLHQAQATIDSVRRSTARLGQRGTVLVVRDTPYDEGLAGRLAAPGTHSPRTRVVFTGTRHGSSAPARHLGTRLAGADILLFTDDDVVVDDDWAATIAVSAARHGTCTGRIRSRENGFWQRCDETIDDYRVRAVDSRGRIKFVSFPNLAIRRTLLPDPPFDASCHNLVDDIDLACGLRLSGVPIHFDDRIVVHAQYPTTFREFLARKIRHGKGMGRLRARLHTRAWRTLELGSTGVLFLRWTRLSRQLTAGTGPVRLGLVLTANLSYCAAFALTAGWCTLTATLRRSRTEGRESVT